MLSSKKGKEQRKYRRVEAKVEVRFMTDQDFVTEYTKNISRGGILLKTDRLLDPNAEIDLTMKLPNDRGDFHVRGRVTRLMSMSDPSGSKEQVHGAGIRFVDPPEELLKALEEVVHDTGLKKG